MPYALLSLGWLSVVAVGLAVTSGLHLWPALPSVRMHVLIALTATIVALLSHTMTMFYFIGTGKKIKDFVAEWDEETKKMIRAKIIETKRKLFPAMTLICFVIMAAFILGGAVDSGMLSKPYHQAAAYLAAVMHVHVTLKETLYLFKNIALIDEVNQISRSRFGETAA